MRSLAVGAFALLLAWSLVPEFAHATEWPLLRRPTLGGPLLWSDYVVHHDWRIQRHVTLGHYRLLDDKNRVVVAGSMSECHQELNRQRQCGNLRPLDCHVVIVMHGLAGSRRFMAGLAEYLREHGGYTVLNFGYASTRGTIQEHTQALESVIRNLPGVQEVSLVGHSMSNIMVRHLLFRIQRQRKPPSVSFRRMVMISPPNHGTPLADTLGQRHIFQLALGEVVDQFALTKDWYCLEPQLETPWFEFGIIAGGKCDDEGYLSGIPGDDDMIVPLSSHWLEGASDFCQVGGLHQFMPKFDETKRAALCFLKHGHF